MPHQDASGQVKQPRWSKCWEMWQELARVLDRSESPQNGNGGEVLGAYRYSSGYSFAEGVKCCTAGCLRAPVLPAAFPQKLLLLNERRTDLRLTSALMEKVIAPRYPTER